MMRIRHALLFGLISACVICATSVHAVYEKKDGFPWNLTLQGHHDKPIADALPSGSFFMNVGPTGIRAQITHENPAWFTVKFVFPKSPAAGKIKAGDIILGANGKVMDVPHQFGRRTVTGWEGPMTEMSKHIEDSQGTEGKLELIVWPGGDRKKQTKVMLEIEPVGRFSKTFPYNCERSDKLMGDLCNFLANEYQSQGKFGRIHAHTASTLALMASGDEKYAGIIRQVMSGYGSRRYSSMNGGGFQCWTFGHDGILMGEYYLLTKDKSLLPAFQSLGLAMDESQDPQNGGYSHKPYPFIMNRVAEGGPRGYGAMSGVAGLIFTAQSLMKAAGVASYPETSHERLHQGYMHSFTQHGEIGYGLSAWHHAVIEPQGESVGVAKNKKGIGYEVTTGMEGIEKFKVTWPTPDDTRGGPIDWLGTKEVENARVFILGQNKLLVVRDMSIKGPSSPTQPTGRRIGHIFRSGGAALGYGIGSGDNKSWKHLSRHYANACASSPNALLDGHASTLLHTLWGSLGAARADERAFRYYMDGIKWWFIMAQTHDGSFVPMPGRDYASTDHVYAGRTLPTATAALILSVKDRNIQITGADSLAGIPKAKDSGKTKTPDRKAAADLSVLGEGFSVEHCAKEAKLFTSEAPYVQALRALDHASGSDSDYGKEAKVFADKIREWLLQRNSEVIMQALTNPAQALTDNKEHMRRLAGLDDFGAIEARAMVDALGDDRETRALSRYYEQLQAIEKLEAERGKSPASAKRREQLKDQLARYLEKQGLSKANTREATSLIELVAGPAVTENNAEDQAE